MEGLCFASESLPLPKDRKRTFQYEDEDIHHRQSKRICWMTISEPNVGSHVSREEDVHRIKSYPQRNISSRVQSPRNRLFSRDFRLRKPFRTPYYVPADTIEDIDQFIRRKPTRPMKVMSGRVRLDRRREYVPRGASSAAPLIPMGENTLEDSFIMPSVCRMRGGPQGMGKKLFLIPQLIVDEKNLLLTPRTKSAEASPAKEQRAQTRKAMSHFFANTKVPTPAQTSAPTNAAEPPIKLTFQLKPRSPLHADDSPVEYVVKFTL